MEHLTNIISSLAWPVTILIIAWKFHAELIALIQRIGKIKHGKTEIDFSELKQAVAKVESQHEKKEMNETGNSDFQQVNALLTVDPYSAVIYSWIQFAEAGRRLVDGPTDHRTSDSTIVQKLLRKKEIDRSEYDLIKQIQHIRNMATHRRNVGLDELTAFKVTSILMQLTNEFNRKSNQSEDDNSE